MTGSIYINNSNDIIGIFNGNIPIIAVYYKGQKLWPDEEEIIEDVLSCFSNGYWNDNYPWEDNMPWVD